MAQAKNNILHYWEKIGESWRFAILAFMIARLFYFLWSWVIFTIQPVVIQNLEFSGEPILSVFKIENSEAHVYLREVNGNILTFQTADAQHVIDQQTGSVWDISTGQSIQGKYKGTTLSVAETSVSHIFPYQGTAPYQDAWWLAMLQRFDANWYIGLAENGYGSFPGNDHFPPLFPLLIRTFQPIFGSAFFAGLFVSQAATLFTLKLLYDLFTQWGEKTTGTRALLLFIIYPTFFFFFSVYSEPVFLVAALLALRAMQQRQWAWAGFWIFCAISTRLQGAALVFPMLYLIWKDQPPLRKLSHWFGLFIAGLGGLFYLYLRSIQVSNAVPVVEDIWKARIVPPWETYLYAVRTIINGNASFIDILNWSVMTLFVILLVWGWKKIPLEYNLYTAVSIFIILIRIVENQPLISMSRYSLMLFPVFYPFSLAAENPVVRRIIIYGFILLHLYLSGQFFIWGWVA
jgi:hypothetical protein